TLGLPNFPTVGLSPNSHLGPVNSRTSPNSHLSTLGLPPTLTRQLSDFPTSQLSDFPPTPTSDLSTLGLPPTPTCQLSDFPQLSPVNSRTSP
ncbi:MAG: hypothetical protein P5693_26550, partial [Limnospira sp. PMC 1290.21]|nr:hypothetical protein [Limnospira sp. PMC 1290.21]